MRRIDGQEEGNPRAAGAASPIRPPAGAPASNRLNKGARIAPTFLRRAGDSLVGTSRQNVVNRVVGPTLNIVAFDRGLGRSQNVYAVGNVVPTRVKRGVLLVLVEGLLIGLGPINLAVSYAAFRSLVLRQDILNKLQDKGGIASALVTRVRSA